MNPETAINVAYALVIATAIGKFNTAVKDFITSEFIMFCVFSLFMYTRNKNILVSMAIAFFSVVGLKVLMTEDLIETAKENFEQIVGKFEFVTGVDVKLGCENITVADLLKKFNGDERALKQSMMQSNVPYNLPLTDDNAPLISTYLVAGDVNVISDSCTQFVKDDTNEFKI